MGEHGVYIYIYIYIYIYTEVNRRIANEQDGLLMLRMRGGRGGALSGGIESVN